MGLGPSLGPGQWVGSNGWSRFWAVFKGVVGGPGQMTRTTPKFSFPPWYQAGWYVHALLSALYELVPPLRSYIRGKAAVLGANFRPNVGVG